jgi:hypothetical protein
MEGDRRVDDPTERLGLQVIPDRASILAWRHASPPEQFRNLIKTTVS